MALYIEVPDFEDVFKTAMTLFNEAKRPELVAQLPDLTEDEIKKELGQLWKRATKEEKAPFDREATRQDSYRKRVYGHIKLPLTAYKIWYRENKEEFMRRDPGVKNRTLQKRMESEWGYMKHEEKESYFEEERIQKARHREACRRHKENLIRSREAQEEGWGSLIFGGMMKQQLARSKAGVRSKKEEIDEIIKKIWDNMTPEEKRVYTKKFSDIRQKKNKLRKDKLLTDKPSLDLNEMADELNSLWEGIPEEERRRYMEESAEFGKENPYPTQRRKRKRPAEVPQSPESCPPKTPAPVPAPALVPAPTPASFSLLINLLSDHNQPLPLNNIQPTFMATKSSYPPAPVPSNACQQLSSSSESLSAPVPNHDDQYQPQNPDFYWNPEPQISQVPHSPFGNLNTNEPVPLDNIEPTFIPGYGTSQTSSHIHYEPLEPVLLKIAEPTFMANQWTQSAPVHYSPLISKQGPLASIESIFKRPDHTQPSFEQHYRFSPPATPAHHYTPLTSSQPGPIPYVALASTNQPDDFSWEHPQQPSFFSNLYLPPPPLVPNALSNQEDNLEDIEPSLTHIDDFPWEYALQTIL